MCLSDFYIDTMVYVLLTLYSLFVYILYCIGVFDVYSFYLAGSCSYEQLYTCGHTEKQKTKLLQCNFDCTLDEVAFTMVA